MNDNGITISGKIIKVFNKNFSEERLVSNATLVHERKTKDVIVKEYYSIETWNNDMEKYLQKEVVIEGYLNQYKYEKDNTTHYNIKILANNIKENINNENINIVKMRGYVNNLENDENKTKFIIKYGYYKQNKDNKDIKEKVYNKFFITDWNKNNIKNDDYIYLEGKITQTNNNNKVYYDINAKKIEILENKKNKDIDISF